MGAKFCKASVSATGCWALYTSDMSKLFFNGSERGFFFCRTPLGVRRRPMPEGLGVRRRPMPEGLGVRRRPMPDLNVPNDAFRLDVSGATQDSFQPLDGSPAGRASTLYPPAALRRFTRPPRVDGSNPCEKIQDPRSGVADSAPPHSEDLLVPHSIARCFLLGSGDCRLYAPSVHVSTRPLHASRYASL